MDKRLDRLIRKHGLAKYREIIHALTGQAVRLHTKPLAARQKLNRGVTKFGGAPDVPKTFRWPMRGSRPLTFIAQVNVAEFKKLSVWPDSGQLLFFYDAHKQPWGFDPKDRRGSTIIHVSAPAAQLRPMRMPGNSNAGPDEGGALPECAVRTSIVTTIPPVENAAMAPILTNQKLILAYHELYEEFSGVNDDAPNHQLFGWPLAVQSDMERECQLAFHGIDCGGMDDSTESPRANALAGGATRWQLLLQVGSDDNLGVMWGDLGKIYFFATAESRASLKFDETWTILQCS